MTLAAPSNRALEDAVRREPTNPDVIAVYADWLTEQGSPYGDLMSVRDARTWETCGLPGEDRLRVTWRHGLWESLRVDDRVLAQPGSAALEDLEAVFSSPPCIALAALELVAWTAMMGDRDRMMLIAIAARMRWAPHLVRLAVGDDTAALARQALGYVGESIARGFPRLEHLTLRSGIPPTTSSPFGFDGLQLEHLHTLEIELAASRVDYRLELDRCRLPALETLVLRGAGIGALVPALLRGSLFERIRHLALHGLAVDIALDAILPNATLAGNLETLDLSGSSLTSAGARALVAHRGMFRALVEIDVSATAIPAHDVVALREAYPNAAIVR